LNCCTRRRIEILSDAMNEPLRLFASVATGAGNPSLTRSVGSAPLAPLMGGAYELTKGAFFRNDWDM
jgi:hypothetical protein